MKKIEDYRGKAALVTGAADGIGAALVERLAAAGARVFASDIDAAKLDAMAARIGVEYAICDVSDEDAVEHLFDRAWSALGPIDLVCANAGVIVPGSLLEKSSATEVPLACSLVKLRTGFQTRIVRRLISTEAARTAKP